MSEHKFEARQSKRIVILGSISACIFILFFIGLAIFALYCLIKNDYVNYDSYTGDIFGFCFSMFVVLVVSVIMIYILYKYKYQRDIYTETKMIRKIREKVIFELPYENIITIKEGFDSLFMVLKTHIIEKNGKKGTRNFYEHYSRADISQIKRMITEKYYNITFQ